MQHSSDGKNFNLIGELKGEGSTQEIHKYKFIHNNPNSGMNYYRIKQVDFDGKYSYSEIINVYFKGKEISIYPNPGKEEVLIISPTDDKLQIFNQFGKLIKETNLVEGENHLDLQHLHPGMYIFKTESGKTLWWVKM